MVFGEIVEPSTRALIDDDLEEYPEYQEIIPVWEGNFELPKEIETLIFIETEKVRKLFHACILDEKKPVAKINNAGIEIFNIDVGKYIIVFSEKKDFTTGQITELFEKWIAAAKNIFTITSDSINSYQNFGLKEKPESIIKVLSTDTSKTLKYDQLESPNLVSGLGASVLSYCIHLGLKCTLFIAYVDTSPLDSVNMGPLLNLLKQINVPVKKEDIHISLSSSNLYM